MSELYDPLCSLREGHWFKLICGASFQYLPAVRSLTLAYALAGADCIDVAADPAVITAAKDALRVADDLAESAAAKEHSVPGSPWLMVSLNDGEDPHFRKAEFDSTECPSQCHRPCEAVCPAEAISFQDLGGNISGGVDEQRCYGCGRCLPVCPSQLIQTRSVVSTPEAVAPQIASSSIDAIEIHTQVGREREFQRVWEAIAPYVDQLKLLAISCPDGPGLIEYLHTLYEVIAPLPCPLIWQTDGRPMSGDLGVGTTRATVKLAQKVLTARIPGYVQLAGGTNQHTVDKLQAAGLLRGWGAEEKQDAGTRGHGDTKSRGETNALGNYFPSASPHLGTSAQNTSSLLTPHSSPSIAGIAYGSYARSLLSPTFEELDKLNYQNVDANSAIAQPAQLEAYPHLLWSAVKQAHSLVSQIKSSVPMPQSLLHS